MVDAEKEPVPEPSLEERTLVELGYGDRLDTPIELQDGTTVLGRNFLDGYGTSPHRQLTEDLLLGFLDMDPTEPDYDETRRYILRFLAVKFGPPSDNVKNSL